MPGKLITRQIDAEAAPAKGTKTLWDTEVKGFGARIFAPTARHPKGARSFFLNYRHDGIERRFTIGSRPQWTVEAARDVAKELRLRIDRGEDPAGTKREQREAPTVKDLRDRYVDDHLPTKASGEEGARRNDEFAMLDLICKELGLHTKVAAVHHGDITAMHRAITTARGPVRANRVLAIASKAFSLALLPRAGEDRPWRDAASGNPCKGIKRNLEEEKERFFSDAEVAALSDALSTESVGSAADCIRLIMLTGCRPSEAMRAQWSQFDSEPGTWVKRSAHTKQRKVHRAPLSPPALELVDKLRKKRGSSPWVFPGQNRPDAPIKQLWSVWYAAREHATVALWAASSDESVSNVAASVRETLERERLDRSPTVNECQKVAELAGVQLPTGLLDARIYDFRHSFASIGIAHDLTLPVIGKLLGHTKSRTTERYAHLADDPLRKASNKIGAVISGAGRPGARVVSIKGA